MFEVLFILGSCFVPIVILHGLARWHGARWLQTGAVVVRIAVAALVAPLIGALTCEWTYSEWDQGAASEWYAALGLLGLAAFGFTWIVVVPLMIGLRQMRRRALLWGPPVAGALASALGFVIGAIASEHVSVLRNTLYPLIFGAVTGLCFWFVAFLGVPEDWMRTTRSKASAGLHQSSNRNRQ